jgi:hypothetical protein
LGRSGNGANGADFIFSGIFGPFREWRKMARILFFPGFWAVPGMAQNGYFFRDFWAVREWRKMARILFFPRIFGPFREWRNLSHIFYEPVIFFVSAPRFVFHCLVAREAPLTLNP